jgi:nucleotide-binding universal stress UspA family protein
MSARGTDPARTALEHAIDEATRRAQQASGQILRAIAGGNQWTNEFVATYREKYRRAMSDLAVARALLRDLDEIDALAAGKRDEP